MLSIQNCVKYGCISILCLGTSAAVYYYTSKKNQKFISIDESEFKSHKSLAEQSFVDVIHSIKPNEVSYVQACGLVELVEMINEPDILTVLKLIGAICSYSNNITVLCDSGCVENLLKMFKSVQDGFYSDKVIAPLMMCLKTLSCNDISSKLFEKYMDHFISCIYSKKPILSENCLIILGNLSLFSDMCDYLQNHLHDIISWINDKSNSINEIKAFQVLLHLSNNGLDTCKAILQMKGDFHFVIEFTGVNRPLSSLRNSLIFLNLMFNHMLSNQFEIVEDSFHSFLLSNRDVIKNQINILCENDDEEVKERSMKLMSVLEEFHF